MRKEYVEEYEVDNSGGEGFPPVRTLFKLLLRIVLSPLVVLIAAYIYYDDFRKAVLVALIFYSALTAISLIWTLFQIFLSMMTFNLFKFIRKSFKVITMLVALAVYWGLYLLNWGQNFTL